MKSIAKKRPTNKKPAEKPVSDEIKRAAGRAGIKRLVDPMLLTGNAFNDDGVHPGATLADIIRLMFEASNRQYDGDPVNEFLSDVMLCTADEAELVQLAEYAGDGMGSDAIQRAADRGEHRGAFRKTLDRSSVLFRLSEQIIDRSALRESIAGCERLGWHAR